MSWFICLELAADAECKRISHLTLGRKSRCSVDEAEQRVWSAPSGSFTRACDKSDHDEVRVLHSESGLQDAVYMTRGLDPAKIVIPENLACSRSRVTTWPEEASMTRHVIQTLSAKVDHTATRVTLLQTGLKWGIREQASAVYPLSWNMPTPIYWGGYSRYVRFELSHRPLAFHAEERGEAFGGSEGEA